jgi:phenylpropionate dioxygenase-like ring-hydroxylating dioxygenase large terminal subunit
MTTTTKLADDPTVVQRILDHIDEKTTDLGDRTWREPVESYRSEARFAIERDRVLRRHPTPFCPSAALPASGSYVARPAAGTPIVAVRGRDGVVRAFRNACRHRGTQLVSGAGCEHALVCRYHAWTYDLDGTLRHVPDEHGFPGLDKRTRGLVPVATTERSGLVFVQQDGLPADADDLDGLPPLVGPEFRLLGSDERDVAVNWKIALEGFLEGYHIRSTHTETFYPVQFDNLNVVETFGRNGRIAFPYRAVNKLRKLPPAERSAAGTLTYVYHLFPNTLVATFPGRVFLVALEPVGPDRTRFVTYALTDRPPDDRVAQAEVERGQAFVDAGALEDREVACAIQRGLASGANEFFEFGLFEALIVHFHRNLHAAIELAR